MATDIGKVGIVMKGAWSNSATYEALDAVSYNNGLYIANQDVPANTAPTNTTYWQVAAAPIVKTKSVNYPYTSATTSGTVYTVNNAKTYSQGSPAYAQAYYAISGKRDNH